MTDIYDTESLDSDNSWVTSYGKHVKLVQPNTPWYIEKGKRAEDIHTSETKTVTKNKQKIGGYPRTGSGMFKSSVKMDTTADDLGFGYSYLDRLRAVERSDDVHERFESEKPKVSNLLCIMHIIMMLIVAIVVIFAIFQTTTQLYS